MNDSTDAGLISLIATVAEFVGERHAIDAVATWRRGGTVGAVTRRLKAYAKKAPARAYPLFDAIDAILTGHAYRVYSCLAAVLGNHVTDVTGTHLVFSVSSLTWLILRGAVLAEVTRGAPT